MPRRKHHPRTSSRTPSRTPETRRELHLSTPAPAPVATNIVFGHNAAAGAVGLVLMHVQPPHDLQLFFTPDEARHIAAQLGMRAALVEEERRRSGSGSGSGSGSPPGARPGARP